MASESYEDFVSQILRPTNLENLKEPIEFQQVNILVYRENSDEPNDEESLEFDNIYPFYTVADLSTLIYQVKEEREEYHPQNQCLLIKSPTNKYIHLRYIYDKTNSIEFESPYDLVASGRPNTIFTDLEGNPKKQDITSRDKMLLEDVLFKLPAEDGIYTIHLFLYSDILAAYPGARPINRVDWEGMFRVYFPEFNKAREDGSLSEEIASYAPIRIQRFEERKNAIEKLDELLTEGAPLRKPGESTRGDSIHFSNIRNLRFTWDKPKFYRDYQPFRLESVFYDMPVSKEVPLIRYYQISNTPISKLHVEGPLNIPTIEDPQILQKWAQERPILPESQVINAKVLIRPGSGSVNPLYANLNIFQDGTAMFSIQPNTDSKSLSRQADLYNLESILDNIIKSIPGLQPKLGKSLPPLKIYSPQNIKLSDAYIVLSLWLEKEDMKPITQRSLKEVLPYFRAFFQVTTSPIKEQNPIAFLRYKVVNNFQTPSRDYQYIARILDLQKIQGQTSLPAIVEYYKKEFDVSDEVAVQRVSAVINEKDKYSMVNPETMDYTQKENPGIDIAIFGKYPYYTFHIYRVDSKITLRRIKTLLSLLISVDADYFKEDVHTAQVLEQEEIENVAEKGDVPQAPEEEEEAPDGLADLPLMTELGEENAFGSFKGFGEEDSIVPLETLIKADTPEVLQQEQEAQGKAQGKPVAAVKEEDDDEITDIEQIKQQPSRIYFRKRLQFYDKKLFSYSKTHPSLKKYPSMCAANALKQPTVLREDEFERMKEIYAQDIESGRVLFKEYPVKKGAPLPKPSNNAEIITTLRYGSNLLVGQANIFICSEFWCRYDEIVILKSDFESEIDRKKKRKDKNTCPFCHQGLVKDRNNIIQGESVIKRVGSSGEKHLFVNFLKKTPHPQGLYLPCCFIKDSVIDDKHPAFASVSKEAKKFVASEILDAERDVEGDDKIITVDYKKTLSDIFSASMSDRPYIVGAEKLPLELTRRGPQIGVISKGADTYFMQDSLGTGGNPGLVVQDHTVWKLMIDNASKLPKASGFFRLAAENNKRNQAESFLSAIAPYFGENSASAIKRRILEHVQPILFLSLNYGNFLFDFYSPLTPSPDGKIVRDFAIKRLMTDFIGGVPKESIERAWKGYVAFEAYMKDTKSTKEYRQFAQLLSLKNILYWEDTRKTQRSNGILFIVLEVKADSSIEVRCPPYGVNDRQTGPDGCDVAFILHYESGIWEPLFHIKSDPASQVFETTMVFTRDTYANWPAAVKKRVAEFEKMCHSSGLGVYTDSPFIESNSLIKLGEAMEINSEVYSIMRDIYNHVSFVIFKEDDGLVLLPVIDDGNVYPLLRIDLEWRSFYKKLASPETVRSFYETKIPEKYKDAYQIVRTVRLDKTDIVREFINALQLSSGLHVPVKSSDNAEEIADGTELAWSIDRKIAFGNTTPDTTLTVDYKEFEEIYQHLRFSFANWFALAPGNLKTQINNIIFKEGKANIDLPLYEKRQRLLIILENEIMSWLDSSVNIPSRKPSLKRIDCRVVVEEEGCKDRCVWKGDSSKCLLHVPSTIDLGTGQVNAINLLIKKLIEELIRFPMKRNDLLQQGVSQYVKITEAIRYEDQYIVPENLPAWSELLRMEWTKKKESKYIEEYLAIEEKVDVPVVIDAPVVPEVNNTPVPLTEMPTLRAYFGDKYYFIPSKNIVNTIGEMGVNVDELVALGQNVEEHVSDNVIAEFIAKSLKLSFFQLVYLPEDPVPKHIIVKLLVSQNTIAPFLTMVKMEDGRSGIISAASTFEPIQYNTFPSSLKPILAKIKFIKLN